MNTYHLSLLKRGNCLLIWNNAIDQPYQVGDIINYEGVDAIVTDVSPILEFATRPPVQRATIKLWEGAE